MRALMDGLITCITLGHHSIADPLLGQVCSLEEQVELEDKHDFSLLWIL